MGNELVCCSFLLLLLLALHSSGNAAREREDADGVNVLRIASMDLAQQTEDVKHAYAHDHGHSSSSHMGMGKADMDSSMKVFFRMKDIHVGKTMPFYFSNVGHSIATHFLSKEEADSIPFSSEALPQLLRFFSFSPDSPQAMAIKETLSRCESEAPPGEITYCATSSESLLDFARSIFGSDSQVGVLRTSQIANSSPLYQNFTIIELKDVPAPKMIACHVMTYPYKVYYCHSQLTENKVFRLSLSGDKGDRVDAVSVCHMDTSTWDRSHVSFRLLGTEPGTSEVCHVFPAFELVLVPILPTF